MPYEVGQTATNAKGEKVRFDGEHWVRIPGTGNTGKGGALTYDARQFLNNLSTQASNAQETQRVYERADKDLKILRPGPYKGAFLEAATPEDNGGFFDRLGSVLIGGPARLLGAITPEETSAFQRMRGLQSQQVLQAQIAQKGPQTESDAARMMLTELSPSKTADVNRDIIEKGTDKARRAQAKAIFFTKFANKYGLNGLSEHGMTADQLWNNAADYITDRYVPKAKSGGGHSGIRVISRTKVK